MIKLTPRIVCFSALALLALLVRVDASQAEMRIKQFPMPSGRIAYTYILGTSRDIHVIDFDRLMIVPLVTTQKIDEGPQWSPDGKKLVFHSDDVGDREIFVINHDRSGLTRLTNSAGPDIDPAWSPDGQRITFASKRVGKSLGIFVMTADGTAPIPLVNNGASNAGPKISPRGNEIVFTTTLEFPGRDLALYDLDKSAASQILTKSKGDCGQPSWNPDGSAIAYSYGYANETDIWVLRKGDAAPIQITTHDGREADPTWTDENHLIFAAESGPGVGDFQLFYFDLKTGKELQITEGEGAARNPSWTPFPAPPTE